MNVYTGVQTAATGNAICDFRSDTVTRPSAGMRAAMAEAEVGDDVYGEDPTVRQLEEEIASELGKEAGLFVSSGTQGNLTALLAQCGRGDEIIVGENYHIYHDEAGGPSVLGGIAMLPVPTEGGAMAPEDVAAALRPDDPHYPVSRLLSLENTVAGQALPLEQIQAAAHPAREAGLAVHLDGARFFNAVTALGIAPAALAGVADTVSVCLSKGLGAPAGSVLVGPKATIHRARRMRKLLGGGMRQAGILAAAGLYAFREHREGLAEDHARARQLGAALAELGGATTATNMVFFTPQGDTAALRAHMAGHGVLIGSQSPTLRLVLHRDVDDAALQTAITAFRSFAP